LNDLPKLRAAFSNPLIGWQRLCGGRHERYLACGRPLLYFTPLLLLAQNPQPTPDQNSILHLCDAFGYQKKACGPAYKYIVLKGLAEREGFEPSVQVLARTTV